MTNPRESAEDLSRRSLLRLGLLAGAAGVSTLAGAIPAQIATAATPDIAHGSRTIPNVALTFHGAGSKALAQKLLAILKSTQTPATVFAVGAWLKADNSIAKEILDSGHDLGNHTMNHLQSKTLSATNLDSEIAGCAKELITLTGSHGKFFRPSGTQYSTALIRKTALKYGYKKCISYDVDSHDYQDVGKAAVVKNVMTSVRNGSIISLHFGHQDTIDALPTLITDLHDKGLTPVTLSTMLGTIK
jgi:peptidoglycan/xylan/chitin deacetylase (PgdA/CDA1 family)